jgi:hypothetical protein
MTCFSVSEEDVLNEAKKCGCVSSALFWRGF